jgi:molybdopterin-binding protein
LDRARPRNKKALIGLKTSLLNDKAVDELALKVGDDVSAVIKSSDVMIGK